MKHLHTEPLRKPFFTPGTFVLLTLITVGFSFGIARLFLGLGPITNLTDSYPWGIWIAIDVACGVALAAGGFTTAALVDIFGKKKYHVLLRPAVLTAWLGYLMVAIGLMFDLGRYWNIWQPVFNWQGNSVMFELAMCVMAYLVVLTFEVAPSILEGLKDTVSKNLWGARILGKIEKPIMRIHALVKVMLPILIVAGVVLSCMHQSSLGTLMVIAPSKLNALWHTAWLPALFLLSAIMVGFPMVIIEAASASKAFRREAEIEILDPLASKIPWFIAVYGFFRFGDLLMRWDKIDFLQYPGDTVSFVIEIVVGILLPLVLLSIKPVRKSMGWLFACCFMVVFGVILNRLNVFLVGYHPANAREVYFPSVGEIALTVGLISLLIFLYRFFANYFPVLPVVVEGPETEEEKRLEKTVPVEPRMAWIIRGSVVFFLLTFIVLYVVVHKEAITESRLTYGEVFAAVADHPSPKEEAGKHHQFRPEKYLNYYMLTSPILEAKTDYYEPVRFSHRTHDVNAGSDCYVCHHRYSEDENDRVGQDIKEMHLEIETRIGGACGNCHEDLNEKTFNKCSFCHVASNEADYPARIGLKGAYHRQCIDCHRRQPESANAPVDCQSCHHPLTPDHGKLVHLPPGVSARRVTAKCLECHPSVGEDILASAHWNWEGLTPAIEGHEHSTDTGLLNVVDNYTITMRPDLTASHSFHIGYMSGKGSGKLLPVDQVNAVDCLVCHDTTGTYNKNEGMRGLPGHAVNLVEVSKKVGRPSRKACGACHFNVGGGPNVKHGDLDPVLTKPAPETDVHMGMVDMRCQDCHHTEKHRISGLSFMAPVTEGRATCENCHGDHPHGITGYLSRHLDDHVKAVSCQTCHIPYFAPETPTLMATDFSQAGEDREVKKDRYGMPTYDKNRGALTWGKQVAPVYRWFNGTRKSYLLGDEMVENEEGQLELNAPLGEKHIPESRIFPFKVHTAKQPFDKENNKLVPVKFKNGYWTHFDWNRAIKEGCEAAGVEYSGQHDFVETRMYTSIHHGVVPAKKALGCSDCHKVEAITCRRCHKSAQGMDQPEHTRMIYPGQKNRMDFKALGYEDDPAIMGGRFYLKLGRGTPPR